MEMLESTFTPADAVTPDLVAVYSMPFQEISKLGYLQLVGRRITTLIQEAGPENAREILENGLREAGTPKTLPRLTNLWWKELLEVMWINQTLNDQLPSATILRSQMQPTEYPDDLNEPTDMLDVWMITLLEQKKARNAA